MYQNGFTPLVNAAWHDRFRTVEYLVERGADTEAKDFVCHIIDVKQHIRHCDLITYQNGFTPLVNAALHDRFRTVEYLVERGANMEAKDKVSDAISLT